MPFRWKLVVAALSLFASQDTAAAEWQLAWSDEFDKPSIDAAKWGFEVDCWGDGNGERQCYTASKRNAEIENGKLVITALKQRTTGPALPKAVRAIASDPNAQVSCEFTSAKLTTKGKAAWRNGRIEVRAMLPQGQGSWPAIWMLPEKDRYGAWTASGEINILEAVNLGIPCATCAGGGRRYYPWNTAFWQKMARKRKDWKGSPLPCVTRRLSHLRDCVGE